MPKIDPRHTAALADAAEIATRQGGVASRKQLYAAGVTRWQIRRQVDARRWQKIGDQSVATHNGDIADEGWRWAAVFQGGPRACLDGAAALVAAGLARFTVDRLRVSVPRGARVRRTNLFDIRQTRRWDAQDIVSFGVPRTRPAVAAVRAGLWAKSDKQAALVITMAVQQGIVRVEDVARELLRIRRAPRRLFLHAVVNDLLDGSRSLGELDVARELRRRGIPAPDRQTLRIDKNMRYYLDLYWFRWRLVVEIDGIHHTWAQNVIGDALRQNALAISGETVLRLPLLGLRLDADLFFDQIEQALQANGYRPAA